MDFRRVAGGTCAYAKVVEDNRLAGLFFVVFEVEAFAGPAHDELLPDMTGLIESVNKLAHRWTAAATAAGRTDPAGSGTSRETQVVRRRRPGRSARGESSQCTAADRETLQTVPRSLRGIGPEGVEGEHGEQHGELLHKARSSVQLRTFSRVELPIPWRTVWQSQRYPHLWKFPPGTPLVVPHICGHRFRRARPGGATTGSYPADHEHRHSPATSMALRRARPEYRKVKAKVLVFLALAGVSFFRTCCFGV